MSEPGETVYVTGMGAATRAGEWLKHAEKLYEERAALSDEPEEPAVAAQFGVAWATLAVALRP